MIKYKIIEMVDGKVTFTKKELEELLEEVYNEGYENGQRTAPSICPPGMKELSNEPMCLDKTIVYTGAPIEMHYKGTSAGEENW